MTDFRTILANMRRPRLLIRAARHGLHDYQRDRDLRRLIDQNPQIASETALSELMLREESAEATRRLGDASYSIARHIDLLIAIMAELSLLQRDLRV